MHLKSVYLGVAATALAASLPAFAAAQGWILKSNSASDGTETPYIHMTAESGQSLSLYCSDDMDLQAVLYLNGDAAGTISDGSDRNWREREVEMTSDTTEAKTEGWFYNRPGQILVSSEAWQAKRIFNSAVKGEPITLDIRRVGEYSLTLPPVDDAFKDFVQSCDQI